jgi:hypothetical protein
MECDLSSQWNDLAARLFGIVKFGLEPAFAILLVLFFAAVVVWIIGRLTK